MPPVVIDIRSADDSRDVVHRAVQALTEGQLVAFPTETVYGVAASALSESAIERLIDAKSRGQNHPFTLAIKSADDALDYVPNLSPLGRRLARRCWPGPVTIVVDDNHPDSLLKQLPSRVREVLVPSGRIGLRVPAHPTILDVLRMLVGPMVLSSANRHGQPDPLTASEVVAGMGNDVQMVLDDGRSRFGQPSSVVLVDGNRVEVLRAGVVSQPTLKRLASQILLFVCTGNTCRSPMAEAICRKLVAERLKCTPDKLEDHGVLVMSAGIAAMVGGRPSPEAVQVMSRRGLNIADHESQPVTSQLVRHADWIFAMTQSHRQAIVAEWPEASDRTVLLCHDRADIPDPIGGTPEQYERCAQAIEAELKTWVQHLEFE